MKLHITYYVDKLMFYQESSQAERLHEVIKDKSTILCLQLKFSQNHRTMKIAIRLCVDLFIHEISVVISVTPVYDLYDYSCDTASGREYRELLLPGRCWLTWKVSAIYAQIAHSGILRWSNS